MNKNRIKNKHIIEVNMKKDPDKRAVKKAAVQQQ